MKKLLIIGILLVVIGGVTVLCFATDIFDKNDHNTWYAPAEEGGIDDSLAEKIKVGMTFDEIVAIIGKPQRDVGSGAWLMEWEMKSGNILVVAFNAVPDSERNLISYNISINSK